MDQTVLDKINHLRKTIEYHEKKYYVDNDPQISDFEFDKLVKELQKLEKDFPEFVIPESPTQRVGEQPLEGFVSVRHSTPMLSLDNCYSIEEIRSFQDRLKKIIPEEKIGFVVELICIALIFDTSINFLKSVSVTIGFEITIPPPSVDQFINCVDGE